MDALHIMAVFSCYVGYEIAKAWREDDGDGNPNILDKHDNRKDNKGMRPV